MGDPRYNVSPEAVRRAACELEAACGAEGIDLRILPGADVRVQPETLADLDAGRILTVGDAGRFLLVDLPTQTLHPVGPLLFELQVRGLAVVLTHPERHPLLSSDLEELRRLVERGCLVQITGSSLLGGFGCSARRAAERMLREGLVHVVASDAHGSTGPRRPQFGLVVRRLLELVGERSAAELVCERPGEIAVTQRPATVSVPGVAQ
jgi:protein-tyrosine phosphatase